jgi:hypothetical protein
MKMSNTHGLPRRLLAVGVTVALIATGAFVVAAASPARGKAQRTLPRTELVTIARSESSGLGDSHVKTALIVVTTKDAAENWMEPGAVPPGPANPRAYLIVLSGRFVCEACSVPAGAQLPNGHSMQIIWVPSRGVTDFGLTARTPRGLTRLGRVVTLSLIHRRSP